MRAVMSQVTGRVTSRTVMSPVTWNGTSTPRAAAGGRLVTPVAMNVASGYLPDSSQRSRIAWSRRGRSLVSVLRSTVNLPSWIVTALSTKSRVTSPVRLWVVPTVVTNGTGCPKNSSSTWYWA